MRFRAKLSQDKTVVLIGVINLLEKLGKSAVIFLTEDFFRTTIISDNPDGSKIFCELKSDEIFHDYRIESQSSNSILFEISLSNLSSALNSGRNAPRCNLKLVKRDDSKPYLCFETRVGPIIIGIS